MNKQRFTVSDKEATLYLADTPDKPLILLNNYSGDGSSVVKALREMECPEFNLLSIGGLNWDHDMTPWYCPPISPGDTPCTGGANGYLELLTDEILPRAQSMVSGSPCLIGLAGYSLAGLFALYAMYQCNVFDRVASMSGSLWFPDFKEYVMGHEAQKQPEKLYLSLGDREARTKNPFLKTVQKNTEAIADYYRALGWNVTIEINPGNHFRDAALRSAKGIKAILV